MHLAYLKTISLKCPVRLSYANRLFDVFRKDNSYILGNVIEKESGSNIKNLKHFRMVKFENIFQYCTCKKE